MYRVLGVFIALLFTAGLANAQPLPTNVASPPIAMQVAQPLPHDSTEVLSQSDPRWKNEHLGHETVGAKGCLIMNLVQIALEQSLGSDPEELLHAFINPELITRDGSVKTGMLESIFPSIHILERFSLGRGDDLSTLISDKLAEGSVLLKLAHGRRSHWVRAIGTVNGEVLITDPAGGRMGLLTEFYKFNPVREILVIGGNNNAS